MGPGKQAGPQVVPGIGSAGSLRECQPEGSVRGMACHKAASSIPVTGIASPNWLGPAQECKPARQIEQAGE